MREEDMFGNNRREVITGDANEWFLKNPGQRAIITSLPDMEEIGATYDEWIAWLESTIKNLIDALDQKKSIAFFYQTDRKYKGRIIDKKAIIASIFRAHGFQCVVSKIILKQKPGTVNLYRPTFTNLFAFSRNVKSGRSTPDCIFAGRMIYKNAMGFDACRLAVEFIRAKNITDTIVDPFCGRGSVLRIANDLGFNAVGVDIDRAQTERAIFL